MNKKTVIVIVGPTASGKTSLSIEIAKKMQGEIISADSMQIYKEMDIATAKPTLEEMQGIPHHLMGFLEPTENFSVADFKEKALGIIEDIFERGKQPIVAGGTGFYVDTLIKNTTFFDFDKNEKRNELSDRLEKEGIEKLYDELKEVDPASAEKLHINDIKRILRALEVYYSTGKTITLQSELSHENESEHNWFIIGLTAENREILYDRINRRVDIMLDNGLLDEAEKFFSSEKSGTSKQAIGYKELKPYLDGEATLEEVTESLKRETRRYAKRQLTWFRRNPDINWIDISELSNEEILKKAFDLLENGGLI
ncbi:MAG: tRNA (adenosine(37)-N6)-dimethylallyltransferase MiaA [Clostridia bacterium]|nr:tRNA (adenosine(37)-N6)-dimethylallyltransferase MiaA [Clostridia bacterium]